MRQTIFLILCCFTVVLPLSLSFLSFGLMLQAFIHKDFGLVIAAVFSSCAVPLSCYVIIDVMFEDEKKLDLNRYK